MSAQNTQRGSLFGAIVGFFGFSALAGLLVAIMVTPAIAVTGMTASNSIGIFEGLPEFITIDEQPQRNRIFANGDGGPVQIATLYRQNREEVGWEEISQFAKDATVAGEDRRFYEHGGVDPQGILRAAVDNLTSGGISSGASTLTMQLVKNIYVQRSLELPTEEERDAAYAEAVDPSFERKLKEMKLAIGLEKEHSKDDILLAYLNIADFNSNTYGIQAAAQRYYNTTAANLTLAQAASLIAIVQYPNDRGLDDPENYPRNQERRDHILRAMLSEEMIDQAQFDEAIATPVDATTVTLTNPQNGCTYAHSDARQVCDYVVRNVKNLSALGTTAEERAANWSRGGYDIYTSIDLELQGNAQALNRQYAPMDETRLELGSATSSVEVGTGRIIIMAQNKEYNDTQTGGGPTATALNFNTDFEYGGSTGFQPGSTYKMFTLLNWLQNGHGLNEVLDDSIRAVPFREFTACNAPLTSREVFRFKNDDGAGGRTPYQATTNSVNSAFVAMARELDLCGIRDTAASIGVHRADGTPLQTNPSSVLGTNEVAPLSMAAAYAAIAGQGMYCEPIIVDRVVAPDGAELPGQQQVCEQRLEPEVANTAAFAMASVISSGTGRGSRTPDGVPMIGKTGTTDSSNQTWVVTSTTKVATAQWVGNIKGQYAIRSYPNGSARRHSIMRGVMTAVNATFGGDRFAEPSQGLLVGSGAFVPDVVGRSLDEAKSLIESANLGFADGGQTDSDQPAGTVVRTDPGANAKLARGQTVTVFTSNGSQAGTVPDVVGDDIDDARGELSEAGYNNVSLSYEAVPGNGGGGGNNPELCRVTAQSPGGGTNTSKSTTVSLTVRGTPEICS